MNQLLLVLLLLLGIAFIVFGILILFLPEVFEDKKGLSTATNPTTKKKDRRFFAWFFAHPTRMMTLATIGAIITLLLVTFMSPSPSSSGSSTSSGNPSTSSITSNPSSSSTNPTSSVGGSSSIPSSSSTVTSLLIQYTVTFDALGGSNVDVQTVEQNGLATDVVTEKTGYTFGGWFTSVDLGSTLGDAWDFQTMITSDITLYAKWTINTYTITYVLGGGTYIAPINVVFGNNTIAPNAPTRVGYTFAGWYLENTFTTAYPFNEAMPAQSFSLFAKWTPVVATITFVSNGGNEVSPITQDYQSALTFPANPVKDDSMFGGWYSNTSFTGNPTSITTMPANSFSLYAKWFRLFSDIQVGGNFSLGTAPSGRMYVWGANANGQLGNGTTAFRQNTPTLFTINSLNVGETITKINLAGAYGFATTSEGRIFTWGETPSGRFLTPTLFTIAGLNLNETIASIHTNPSSSHVFFITSENRVFAQGANLYGQLGLGSGAPTQVATPTLLTFNGLIGGEFIDRFSVGGTFTVALTNLNRIYAMGENRGNQLGDGSATGRYVPTMISNEFLNGENITYIKSGKDHTILITANDKIYAWGLNAIGNGATYGDGTTANVTEPTEMVYSFLNSGESITELEVGSLHNYVRTSSGRYFAWGFGGESRLANGSSNASIIPIAFTTPTLEAGETIVNIISSPGPVTFMLTSLNRTLAFGRGMDGQIGDGDPNVPTATAVKGSPIFI
jgi:uncharacterized repeat protein (TIGR02543 family)